MKIFFAILLTVCSFSSFNQPELVWVAIGDSITYLNDHLDETDHRVTKGYLTGVTEQMPNIRYVNQGHNGWTSGGIAANIEKLGIVKADVYSIFLGTNDWWQGRSIGTIEDYKSGNENRTVYGSFRIIIDKIKQLNPQAKIVLITPMQRNDFVYIADANNNAYGSYKSKNGQSLEKFALAIKTIGAIEQIPVIDLYHEPSLQIEHLVKYKRLKDHNGAYQNYTFPSSVDIPFDPKTDDYPYPLDAINYTYDGLHPSDKGNAQIATKIVAVFKALELDTRWKEYINLTQYNEPFWKADTIIDESVQMIRDGHQTTGSLLFPASKIIAIKMANRSKDFKKGKDWNYQNGKIILPSGSEIPYFDKDSLLFTEKKTNYSMTGKLPGSYVLFNENAYFSSHQISVTYIPTKNSRWNGPIPSFAQHQLPNTLEKLATKKTVTLVFYGNSIETGYNASSFENVAPYMPIWPQLVTYNLRSKYGSRINYINNSVPGITAAWGLDSVQNRVSAYHPDLVIIGFGMNDGSSHVSPDDYISQIKGIISKIKSENPKAEFILIAPMLANPDAVQSGVQAQYKAALQKLEGNSIALADITGVHQELLKHKTYQDMTGNNVNHPNDYLSRWYAHIVSSLLIRY